jgi:hypothetical protein
MDDFVTVNKVYQEVKAQQQLLSCPVEQCILMVCVGIDDIHAHSPFPFCFNLVIHRGWVEPFQLVPASRSLAFP